MTKPLTTIMISAIFIIAGCATTQNQNLSNVANENASSTSENVRLSIPVYSQKIFMGLPSRSWQPVFESHDPSYRIEFIPSNEASEDWKNLISIQGFRGFVKNFYRSADEAPKSLLALYSFTFRESYESKCPEGKFVFEPAGEVDINTDNYLGFIMGCLVPSKIKTAVKDMNNGELGYYILIEGSEDLYLIHKAVRAEEVSLLESLNKANAAEFISSIEPIRLCEKSGPATGC